VLVIDVGGQVEVEIGTRRVSLTEGTHVYVGSARGPGGLRARISRHLRREKKERWHIDSVLSSPRARVAAVVYAETCRRTECSIVERLLEAGFTAPVRGLGSSDCKKCPAHFLRAPCDIVECTRVVAEALASLRLEPKVYIPPREGKIGGGRF